MVVTPWLLGCVWAVGAGRLRPSHIVLFAFWLVGYFAFHATTLWLRSRFKNRYLPPVATYGGVAGVLGLVVLLLSPQWGSWLLVYAPLCAAALWLAWRRRDRDVLSGLATIAAACLIPLVMGSDGLSRLGGLPVLGWLALICFGYFFGTVLYVKTLVRERGKRRWVVGSVAWSLLCAVVAVWTPAPLPAAWVVAFFVIIALRSLLLPLLGPLAGRRVDIRKVGIAEFVTTAALLVVLVPALVA